MNGTNSGKAMPGPAIHGTGVPKSERIIDICLGTAFLAATLPVSACAALAVKLSSTGSVLDTQDRVGPFGHPFREYRFRCEDDAGLTALGRFMIRTRVDEIPNAINVIKGDMSFFAPDALRPFAP